MHITVQSVMSGAKPHQNVLLLPGQQGWSGKVICEEERMQRELSHLRGVGGWVGGFGVE